MTLVRIAYPRSHIKEFSALDALAEAGEVTRSAARRAGWRWTPTGLGLAPGTTERLLDAERAEGGDD